MKRTDPSAVTRVACVGAGTVGAGWAACCLARSLDVIATDPGDDAAARLAESVERAWPSLEASGLASGASRDRLRFTADLAEAVDGAEFVQESAPDDEALKIDLLARIAAACPGPTVIASSSSRFLPSRIAARAGAPERIVVGHPFVPSYLMPLVEVVGGEATDPAALDWAMAFYSRLGKRPLRLAREVEAYVANRLHHALFEEALRLVEQGVCSYDDIDTAVVDGLGPRWAFSGPMLHRHLGGGGGGVRRMIEHFGWRGPPGTEARFVEAIEARWGAWSMPELERWRDDNLLAILGARRLDPGAEEGEPT